LPPPWTLRRFLKKILPPIFKQVRLLVLVPVSFFPV
jgi:hypothetical protein